MSGRASIYVKKNKTKTVTHKRVKLKKGNNKSKGNPNRCPVCGKYMSK